MALTVAYEGLGVIANADQVTDDTGGLGTGDWGELGAGYIDVNPDVYLYGSASMGSQYASKVGYSYFDRVTPINFDSTWAGNFIYMWINISAKGAFTTADSFCVRIGTSNSANYNDYFLANKNDSNGWAGGWKLFVIDPTKTRTSGNGTLDLTSVRYFGNYIATDVSVRADSIWWSQMAVAKGLRILGTSTSGWADAVAYCTDYSNRAWGVLQQREGIYFVYGGLWIGSSTASTATSFVTAGRVIQFGVSEYRNASTNWVTSYPNTANTLVIEDQNGYETIFQDGEIVGSDAGRSGSQFIGDPNSTISMTLYSGNDASSVTKLYGTTFKDIKGTIILGSNTSNQYFSNTFQGCGVMTLGTSSVQNTLFIGQLGLITAGGGVLKNCNFISATVPVALLWDVAVAPGGNLDGTAFYSTGTGHAIELGTNCPSSITLNNMAFNDYGADDTTNAAIYNNSGKAIEISLVGTSQPTVRNGGGASTTFPSSIELKMIVKNEAGVGINGALAFIDDNDETPYIMNTVTAQDAGVDGVAKVTHTEGPVTGARWRVRKYGYKNFKQLIDIEGINISLPVTLVVDPQQT